MIDNQPLIDAFRGINNSYLKLVDSLSALRALSTLDTSFDSDAALLEQALAILMDNQDLERCSIYLLADGELRNAAGMDWQRLISLSQGNGGPCPGGGSFALGEGVVGAAAASGELVHCADCQSDARFLSRESAASVVGSIISVPIMHRGETLGVLNVSHPHPRFFDEGHERSLHIFSNVLGQLLANNRLAQQMEALVEKRTAQLQSALQEADALRQNFERLSAIDELTQLSNRRFFFPESRAALARCLRQNMHFSLMLIDVDHFKVINDNFGHAIGDVILRGVADLLRNVLREGDILARFGGEEFVLSLPSTDGEGALVLAERIRHAIKQHRWPVDGREIGVTVSVGVAELSGAEQGDSQKLLDRLVVEADQALYFGKHHGRDQCHAHAAIACKLAPA